MDTIKGKYASAKIFCDDAGEYARAQIRMLCDNETSRGSRIRIMPDVHPGKMGPIGLTMTVGESILPNLVGIDIGCGITAVQIRQKRVEFQKLDAVIRENIPAGSAIRREPHRFMQDFDLDALYCAESIDKNRVSAGLGTLGGGNHFLEVDRDEDGNLYAVVHSGSRHLGKEVTEYYLRKGQEALKQEGKEIPYALTYLTGQLKEDYLHDQRIVSEYAARSREAILDELVRGMKWKVVDQLACSHNYICAEEDGQMLRKGAVSAKKEEPVIIPVNMKDGILLGTGLGNREWNQSAPHGSGRIYKREEVKNHYTVSDFKTEMKGVYSTCINKETLDEAPFAYRRIADIADAVKETVEIRSILKPVYNYKAGSGKD